MPHDHRHPDRVVRRRPRRRAAAHRPVVVDTTELRNPPDDPAVRARLTQLTGLDPEVHQYVMTTPGARQLVARHVREIDVRAEAGQTRLDVLVHCYGGRHRSVAIAHSSPPNLPRSTTTSSSTTGTSTARSSPPVARRVDEPPRTKEERLRGHRAERLHGQRPLGGQERAGNNARGAEHPSTTRKPHGPKAS
uniref:RapZ C-terminal domain-containing protein n=1 Tax=Streptomyces laurentii TaxID=39478 RepID=UPI0015E84166|nr:RNase adapter RapZ [Streptomyces laurentii]